MAYGSINGQTFAPSGFGLGTTGATAPIGTNGNPDLNLAIQNGWYRVGSTTENSPVGSPGFPEGGYHLVRVDAGRYITQTIYFGFQIWTGCAARRYTTVADSSDTWSDWEWVNPPLQIGVEYQTTERHNAKPVYIKLVSLGSGPEANSVKLISHGAENLENIVAYGGSMNSNGTTPVSLPGLTSSGTDIRYLGANYSSFIWKAGTSSISNYDGTAWIKYTKTTD